MTLPDIQALVSTQKITSKDEESFVKIWVLSSLLEG